MNENQDLNELLIDLGLTKLQAKVYIALTRLEAATGRAVAKAANVVPADVYRVLFELSEKGLLEKVLAKPSLYRAVPLQYGITILLKHKENKVDQIKNAIPKILKNEQVQYKKEDQHLIRYEEGKGASMPTIDGFFKTATSSPDLMTNYREAMIGQDIIGHLLLDRIAHGVKIREILSRNQTAKASLAFLKLQKTSLYEVRYIDGPEPAHLLIKDHKQVYVSTEINKPSAELPHLYFSNPCLVSIIQEWFDNLWNKCSKV